MLQDCKILGLDVSTKSTGWSIVEYKNDKMELIDYGCIERHKMTIPEALVNFEKELINIIEKFRPDVVSAEAPFVGANRNTIQKLANFHGVMMMILEKFKIPFVYYAVMTLKSKVLGGIKTKNADGTKKDGKQMKLEVQAKVIETFGKNNFVKKSLNDDMSDSISCCMTYVIMDGQEVEKKKKTRKKAK
jgi:crossover junction endodeoxyribonuclease RuvC